MSTSVVGIIGSGNIGKDVGQLATAAGLPVVIANSRGPEALGELVAEWGDTASADTVVGAIERADIVVLALPFGAYEALPKVSLSGKVIVDATNYYPDRDGMIAELAEGATTSTEFLSGQWPGARVVKGLNNVDFIRLPQLARPAGSPERTALPVAGDDAEAKAQVVAFLDAIGFDTLDLGGLAEGRRSQPDTPIYVTPYFRPAEPPAEDPMQAFVTALPVPVPLAQARELAAATGA
ncbi:NADPH-dependent F420 reductase [Micromonospora sp. CA-263727]|uniref:NADPH-dependent F420 reductase n=1 Tax=Micromonospora sp. CA-263727 TaxID=3239967 RepID=UPI003D8E2F57